MDLSKAFDTSNHHLLITNLEVKLEGWRFPDMTLMWMRIYICNWNKKNKGWILTLACGKL